MLDLRLGLRMLARYPGLTTVALLGMAVAIAIGAGAFGILYSFTTASLPLDEGDRIVVIDTWDVETNIAEHRMLHDFVRWQASVKSLVDVAAFRHTSRNLIEPGVQTDNVRVTEMSAAGFRVARVAPLMGRTLEDADEQPGAAPVAVIGYGIWRDRFRADAGILGRQVQLGPTTYSIVGVMPDDFAFPIQDRIWVALRPRVMQIDRRTGPAVTIFARLAEGATIESAQAEVTTLAEREALDSPQTHAHLRPRVLPFTYPFFDLHDAGAAWAVHVIQMIISMLLILVSVNVSILVYARTATRHAELAIRTALGASRRRIVTQLFVEGLVLSAAAAALGLLLTSIGLKQVNAALVSVYPQVPFWWKFSLSPGMAVYVVALTLLAASIVGIIPALKATGSRAQVDLKSISAGGGSGMQLGRMWTALIVAQVAVAVALLPPVIYNAWDAVSHALQQPPAGASRIVTMDVALDRTTGAPVDDAFRAEYAARQEAVERQLESEPGVAAVTFAEAVPGTESAMVVEAEGGSAPAGAVDYAIVEGSRQGHLARFNRVDLDFFEMFDVALLAGRAFTAADTHAASGTVIVNRTFVEQVLGGGNALGRRVRYIGRSREVRAKVGQVFGNALPRHEQLGHWYEIVGVVPDFPESKDRFGTPRLYHAVTRGQVYPAVVVTKLPGGAPETFAGRLREIAAAVDPALELRDITTQAQILVSEKAVWRVIAAVLGGFMLSVVALVAAGIYAMMSFTIARRRREIGIRAALGADPRRILGSIFSRAFMQLGLGAVIGIAAAVLMDQASEGELLAGTGLVVLPLVAVFMTMVGLAAAAGPARRGLRIQPTEALRE